jgi:hypothetical protein
VSDAFVKLRTSAAPTSPEYDWGPFVRRVDELQRSNAYLSVKWLHRKVFAGEPGMQEALQIALERGILRTFHRDNPRRASFPTLCCELDITDAIVARTLRERLMPLRALDRERGRR